MAQVIVRENESLESALKRFKRSYEDDDQRQGDCDDQRKARAAFSP